MKLIMAVVNNDDKSIVSEHLTGEGYSITKISTTGGFLMAGNTTFLMVTEDEKVDRAIEIIGEFSKKRTEVVPSSASYGMGFYTSLPVEVTVGGATIFVIDVEKFLKV